MKTAMPPAPDKEDPAVNSTEPPSATDEAEPVREKLPPAVSPEPTVTEMSPPVPDPDDSLPSVAIPVPKVKPPLTPATPASVVERLAAPEDVAVPTPLPPSQSRQKLTRHRQAPEVRGRGL